MLLPQLQLRWTLGGGSIDYGRATPSAFLIPDCTLSLALIVAPHLDYDLM